MLTSHHEHQAMICSLLSYWYNIEMALICWKWHVFAFDAWGAFEVQQGYQNSKLLSVLPDSEGEIVSSLLICAVIYFNLHQIFMGRHVHKYVHIYHTVETRPSNDWSFEKSCRISVITKNNCIRGFSIDIDDGNCLDFSRSTTLLDSTSNLFFVREDNLPNQNQSLSR